jgi:hypothetical protein
MVFLADEELPGVGLVQRVVLGPIESVVSTDLLHSTRPQLHLFFNDVQFVVSRFVVSRRKVVRLK